MTACPDTPIALLGALETSWEVRRVIRHADGAVARFSGQAVWTYADQGWRSVETGRLWQEAASFEARRETLWDVDGNGFLVRFGDGRPFHRIGPGMRPEAMHDCPPDTYRLRYDFTAWPSWSVRWHMIGPRKAYRALTRYHRGV
ncbi:MAG: DUF6314 family protein [Jannaschia sp.]